MLEFGEASEAPAWKKGLGSRMAALFADAGLEDPISEWRGVDAIPAAQRKRQGRPVDLRDTTISLINPFAPMA